MIWSHEYIDLAEFYDKNSSLREKQACLDALRHSLPSEIKYLNTGWMSSSLPNGYRSAWNIIKLVADSSSLSEFWLKAEINGNPLTFSEQHYLVLLLLIYRLDWIREWRSSNPDNLDAVAGFRLSEFVESMTQAENEQVG